MNKKEVQRNEKIEVRVTKAEKKKYKEKAALVGLTFSDYLREFLENGEVYVADNSVVNVQTGLSKTEKKVLYGLANNINQLTKLSHQEKKIHSDVEMILEKIKEILIPNFV